MSENCKSIYKKYCEENKNVPLFLTYGWHEALYGDDWEVEVVEKNGNVQGLLPYVLTNKKAFQFLHTPLLFAFQGIWLVYPESKKNTTKLSFEKEIITSLIDRLPKIDSFKQKFSPKFSNWLPFYWNGYSQTTKYTYIIEDISNTESVFAGFKENIRREIRKAEKTLDVKRIEDINLLYDLKKGVYKEKGNSYPVAKELLSKAYQFAKSKECGELLAAIDNDGNIHSILFYVWDVESAYYLQGGTHSINKTSGSMSLLLWEAIKRSSTKTKSFNFEGSMVESIERYFRSFGGSQVPYFEISKTNSKLLKLLKH